MVKKIRVGLIGYMFMGKAHSQAYRNVHRFFDMKVVPEMKVICGRNEEAVKEAQQKFGWQEYETDWRKLVERDDIDLIDISTPVNVHKDMAVAAAEAGKDVFCEKPLAMSLEEANQMLKAVEKAKVKHMLGFNYRRVPAVCLAKKLIDEGKIGEIYHFRVQYLQSWITNPEFPLVWRLKKEIAGSGAMGDLGTHIIDIARYLIGEFQEVMGMEKIFIKERPDTSQKGKKGKVTVDDATLFLAKFENGALGSFEATRFATGRKNHLFFEINGSKGSLIFDLEDLNRLQFYSTEDPDYAQGYRDILVTEAIHPYVGAWWPHGHIIGWEHTHINQIHDFLSCIAEDKMPQPNFEDGVCCHQAQEAVEKSIQQGKWVKVK